MQTKKSHVALALAAVLFIASVAAFAYAVTPDIPTYGQPGTNLERCGYVISKDYSGVYFARNGTSGLIPYAGTNATTVIQNAVNDIVTAYPLSTSGNGGGLLCFTAGIFVIPYKILITGPVDIQGSGRGRTEFRPYTTGVTIFHVRPSTAIYLFQFSGFKIDNNNVASSGSVGLNFDVGGGGSINEFKMTDVEIRDMTTGITGNLANAYNWFTMSAFLSPVSLSYGTGTVYFDFNTISTSLSLTGASTILNANHVTGTTASVSINGVATTNTFATVTGNYFQETITNGGSMLAFPNLASPSANANVVVSGNVFHDPGTTGTVVYVSVGNNQKNILVTQNQFSTAGTTGAITVSSTGTSGILVKENVGWKTEASGNQTITGAVNTVTVTHGLVTTPVLILITGMQTGIGNYYITARTSTTFTISFENQPGGSTWNFQWYAQTWS